MAIKMLSKAEAEKQRKRSIEKMKAAKARQMEKQKQKQADPNYRANQLEKKRQQTQKQIERQKEKQADPVYQAKQREKKVASIERSIAKAKAKPPATKKTDTKNRTTGRKTSHIKSKGLKGRSPSALERKLMDKIGTLPCSACKVMGRINPVIALHHVDGRVKEFAHAKVLPLCAYHHDVPLTPEERAIHGDMYPVHAKGSYGGKKAFEQEYGTQEHLLCLVYDEIEEPRPWV